jgi:uncharacterized membrane protein (UPF0127 family)
MRRLALSDWLTSTAVLVALMMNQLTEAASPPGAEPLSAFDRSPLTIETRGGAKRFEVWLADSTSRRAQGLMYVERLAPGEGMLFVYGPPRIVSMWMKNTLIPLDMLFIAQDGRVTRIARNTKPQSLETISSMGAVTGVLEIGGGESKRLGIETGDRIVHPAFKTGS